MKDFTDVLVDIIINKERDRIDNIMKEVTMNIQKDFAREAYKLLDEYYENYDPIRYVRIYRKKGRHMKNKKPRRGQVSLHAAVFQGGENTPAIGYVGGGYDEGYYGGISFNSDYFKGNNMRHIGKGKNFTEWNIIENFLFAGQGHYGDWRSTNASGWDGTSADMKMKSFMDDYSATLDRHYQNALKHNK